MRAINEFIQAHGSVGRPVGRFQTVQGAITEGGNGRFKGEPRKPFPAGIREKEPHFIRLEEIISSGRNY